MKDRAGKSSWSYILANLIWHPDTNDWIEWKLQITGIFSWRATATASDWLKNLVVLSEAQAHFPFPAKKHIQLEQTVLLCFFYLDIIIMNVNREYINILLSQKLTFTFFPLQSNRFNWWTSINRSSLISQYW